MGELVELDRYRLAANVSQAESLAARINRCARLISVAAGKKIERAETLSSRVIRIPTARRDTSCK